MKKIVVGFLLFIMPFLYAEQALKTISFRALPIVVIIPSYNNIKWYKKNIDTLIAQDVSYKNWFAIYVDDCSTDGTRTAVKEYIKEKGYAEKIIVIENNQRVGACANIDRMVRRLKDRIIVVLYDGDDWWAHDCVLFRINQAYQNPNVWLTYGQFEFYPMNKPGQCEPLPQQVIDNNDYRSYKWVTSAPRTFYAGLYKNIKPEDLLYNGEHYPMAWDCAMMFPMLEMAAGRIEFINDVLYIYNCTNPINDFRVSAMRQDILARHIRALPRYQKLDRLFPDKN